MEKKVEKRRVKTNLISRERKELLSKTESIFHVFARAFFDEIKKQQNVTLKYKFKNVFTRQCFDNNPMWKKEGYQKLPRFSLV